MNENGVKSKRKLLFVYGYGGGPDSTFCTLLREMLPGEEYEVICYRYNQQDCAEAVAFLTDVVKNEGIDLVIGTSLGGFITLCIDVRVKKMVINPCMRPSVELPLLKPRPGYPEDVEASMEMIATYEAYEESVNMGGNSFAYPTVGFFGRDDELFGDKYVNSFRKHYENVLFIPGGHHGSREAMPLLLLAIRNALSYLPKKTERLTVSTNYQWRFNVLFHKREFCEFVTSRIGYAPANLTIRCGRKNDGSLSLACCHISYGYDHLHNTGLGEYDDFGDIASVADANPECRDVCYDYVREYDPDLFYLIEKYGLE